MLIRTITAIVGLALVVPILCFSHTYVFVAFIALLAFIAADEILACVGQKKNYAVSIPLYIVSLAIPLASRIFEDVYHYLACTMAILFVYMFYLLSTSVITRGKFLIRDAALVFSLGMYVVLAFTSLVLLRDMDGIGKYIYLLPFVGAWVSDIFAYICGRLFGRHKLIPEVSPKKTVEGMIGGIVFTMLGFALYGFVVFKMYNIEPNYVVMTVVGGIVSLVSQLGDLIASIIKRQYGIKDYGKLLPGHGGIMDRFDSMLAVSPFLFIILSVANMFTTIFN